jgi:phospholipid transport system substrate-binding protein
MMKTFNSPHPIRRTFLLASAALACSGALMSANTWAADQAPDAFIQQKFEQVLTGIKASKETLQNGNLTPIMKIVDSLIMPNVNFGRMTAAAVGPAWRRATPEQKEKLQQAFKTLLIRTYAGALRQVNNQTLEMRPFRGRPNDQEVVVQTRVRGQGDPIQIDYRLERTPGEGSGWKIYDLNVLGVWLVDTYRPQFAQQINAGGIDALIHALDARNQANAAQGF